MTLPRKCAVGALVFCVAYAAGFFTGSRRGEVHEEHAAVAATKQVEAVTKHEKVHKTTVTERAKDGSSKTITTVDSGSDSEAVVATASKTTETFSKTVKAQPQYRLRMDAGWNPRLLQMTPSEMTGGLERRLLGPVWGGFWIRQSLGGSPVTAAGLSLAFEF